MPRERDDNKIKLSQVQVNPEKFSPAVGVRVRVLLKPLINLPATGLRARFHLPPIYVRSSYTDIHQRRVFTRGETYQLIHTARGRDENNIRCEKKTINGKYSLIPRIFPENFPTAVGVGVRGFTETIKSSPRNRAPSPLPPTRNTRYLVRIR